MFKPYKSELERSKKNILEVTRIQKFISWWSQAGSNRRPLECHSSALPAELWPHKKDCDCSAYELKFCFFC